MKPLFAEQYSVSPAKTHGLAVGLGGMFLGRTARRSFRSRTATPVYYFQQGDNDDSKADGPNQLPATIYGNNEITCGNSYSALWHVTAWADSNTPKKSKR